MEGGHPAVGAELTRRYGESKEVVHAALGHHDDLRVETPYTVLVAAADAISASRPGARRETLEKYVRRLEELEAARPGLPRRRAGLRDPGRPRGPRDRRQPAARRRGRRPRSAATSPARSRTVDLPRRGQGHRAPRDAFDRIRALRTERRDEAKPMPPLKVLFIGDVVGAPGPQDRQPGPAPAHPALGHRAWSSATPRTPPAARA